MPPRVLLLCAIAAAGCAPRPVAPADLTAAGAQLDSLWARYSAAAVAGDAAAIAALYAEDAVLIESGLPTTRGRAAVEEVARGMLGSLRLLEVGIHPEPPEAIGDHVLQLGTYRDVLQQGNQPVQVVYGRFTALLQRDSTAAWRIRRLMAVMDSTVPRPAP